MKQQGPSSGSLRKIASFEQLEGSKIVVSGLPPKTGPGLELE